MDGKLQPTGWGVKSWAAKLQHTGWGVTLLGVTSWKVTNITQDGVLYRGMVSYSALNGELQHWMGNFHHGMGSYSTLDGELYHGMVSYRTLDGELQQTELGVTALDG